jgi:Protein of unknown function (DUF3105)
VKSFNGTSIAPAVIAAGLTVAMLLATACSGGSGASESDVAKAALDYYTALSDDPPSAYTFLSADCREKIAYLDFVAETSDVRGFLGKGELRIENIQILDQTHDHMTATYDVVLKSGDDDILLAGRLDLAGPKRFVKEDRRWRFADCTISSNQTGTSTPAASASETPQAPSSRDFEPGSPPAIEADDDPSLPGEFVDLQAIYGGYWGNREGVNTAHHATTSIDYGVQGLPPAGGPHWGAGPCPPDPDLAPPYCGPVPWGVYNKSFAAESVVHNMEHAGVIIWYNTSDLEVITQLQDVATENLASGKFIVMMPYADMGAETISLTAWGRRDTFGTSNYDDDRVQAFIAKLECRFDPEQLCNREPSPTPLSGNSA